MINMEGFLPFFGVIEDVDDPEELGRVRVRVYGHHTRNKGKLPVESLPWFSCVHSNSSGVSGIGSTPHTYVQGSTVFGFFIDQSNQTGIVIGSIMGRPDLTDSGQGFSDPEGKYPFYEDGESDVNRLARDPDKHDLTGQKSDQRVVNIPTSVGDIWDEPIYTNSCEYPDNKVVETPQGHVFEVDDTAGSERLHRHHTTGTYEEIKPNGDKVVRVVHDDYEIVVQDKYVYVQGECNLTVGSDCNTYIKGDWNIRVDGNINKVVGKSENVFIQGSNIKQVGGIMDYDASMIFLN